MKKMLLLVLAFLALSSVVYAYSPDSTYVALYADTLRSGWRADKGPNPVTPFELWIWWLPSVRGVQGAEFKMVYPSNVIAGAVTANDSLSISGGTVTTGIYCAWIWCQRSWTWSHWQTCFLKDAAQSQVMISASNLAGKLQVATCEPGYPTEPVRKWNNFCLNYDCGTAVHSTTWGAIKELYR
jgi:hypothetical protein